MAGLSVCDNYDPPASLGAASRVHTCDAYDSSSIPWLGTPSGGNFGPAQSLYTVEAPASATNESPGPTLGTVIVLAVAGRITHLKWYCPAVKPSNELTLPLVLYNADTTTELARVVPGALTADTWVTAALTTPVTTTAGQRVVAAVYSGSQYGFTAAGFAVSGVTSGDLTAPATGSTAGGNGRFHSGSDAFPESTFGGNNYWTDIVFQKAL